MAKKLSSTDSALAKYIVDTIAKNPLSFIPIVQSMLDPSNPDSDKLHEMIAESLMKALTTSEKIKNACLQRILDTIQSCTDKEIFKIVNEQKIHLERDSKEFIKSIQQQTTVTLCEKYFAEKKAHIDTIFEDYFKTISNSIQAHIDALDNKTKEIIVKKNDEHSVNVQVPNHMKDKVLEYMKFLDSQS